MPGGRPPKPTRLKVLAGETRPSRVGRSEPQPRERLPEPPAWLSPAGRAVWDRVVPELEAMALAYSSDTEMLAALCSSVALLAEADRALEAEGKVCTDRDGQPRRNPWLIIRRDAIDAISKLSGSFGITPSARLKLAVSPPRSDLDAIADRLLS